MTDAQPSTSVQIIPEDPKKKMIDDFSRITGLNSKWANE